MVCRKCRTTGYWQSVLQEAERELEAATGNITLKAAVKRYMRAKAEVKRLEQEASTTPNKPSCSDWPERQKSA